MFGQVSLASNDQGTKRWTASGKQFRFEAVNDKSLKLWEGEAHPVLVYNHVGLITSQSALNAQARSSLLHPVYGLDGEVLTDDFPKDHVNHRGLHCGFAASSESITRKSIFGGSAGHSA